MNLVLQIRKPGGITAGVASVESKTSRPSLRFTLRYGKVVESLAPITSTKATFQMRLTYLKLGDAVYRDLSPQTL